MNKLNHIIITNSLQDLVYFLILLIFNINIIVFFFKKMRPFFYTNERKLKKTVIGTIKFNYSL